MSDTPSEQGDKIDLIGTMRNEIDALREQLAEKDKMLKTMRPFFNEYALGPLAKPSCLCCGRNDYKSVAVQHAELPGIVVCDQCKHAEMQLAERDAELAALKGHAVEPRIGLNSDGSLDEVVGSPGHIEQLDSGHWFVEIGEYAIWLHAKGKIVAHYEHRAAYPKEADK